MLPAFGSVLSITIKDTAIAAVIAVPEYMKQSQTLAGESFRPIEMFRWQWRSTSSSCFRLPAP